MPARAFVLLLIATLAGAMGPLAPGAERAVAAADAQGSCVDGWRSLPLPDDGAGWAAYEVLARAGQPAWILGGSNDGPLALHQRNGRWRPVDAGAADVAGFMAGAVRDDGSAMAVGSARPARGEIAPIAGLLKPRRWKPRPVRRPPSDRAALTGVARKGQKRAWAVGTKLVDGHTRAYALRWDGSRWKELSPQGGRNESGLISVDSNDRGDVWAVGWSGTRSGSLRPLVARATGGGWKTSRGADLPAGIGVLTDLDVSERRDAWATGYLVPSGSSRHEVILEHWDGNSWALEPLPWAEDLSAVPRSIAVDGKGGIWIAGTQLRDGAAGPRGFVAHRSGDEWQLHTELLPPNVTSELFSIAVVDRGAVVTGSADGAAVLLEPCDPAEPDQAAAAATTVVAATGASAATRSTPVAGRLALGRPSKPKGFRVRDVTDVAGVAAIADTTRGLTADLDDDGWSDVLYWNHSDTPNFLIGGPDGFRPGPDGAFGPLDRHYCSAADVDGDGTLDVFCSGGRQRGRGIGRHELSLSPALSDGGPAADVMGAIDPFGRGRAVTFMQLDDDGLPELFVATAADRGDGMPGMNRFYRNVAGRLVPAPEVGLDTSAGGWCAKASDIDGDGDEDLLHCVDRPTDRRPAGLRIHVNTDGRLRERSKALGVAPMADIAVLAEDFSGDGRTDLVQLNRNRLRVSKGTTRGFKTIYEAAVPFAMDVAAGDVDGDGRLDLYVVTGNQRGNPRDYLLINGGRGRSFTSVRIPQASEGSGSGVMALDYDHNGLTDFVVLNGQGDLQGPTQLLASFPARGAG